MNSDEVVIKSFNGIGDLLFVTPTLRVIKEAYPDIKIRVNTNFPALLMDNPNVDVLGNDNSSGVFLGYPDPIHRQWPTKHHILSDWEIVTKHYNLKTDPPALQPELNVRRFKQGNGIGVQLLHKGHWHKKKVWPFFEELLENKDYNFLPIQRCGNVVDLVKMISMFKAVVCAEGGISHIAKALGIPAVVIFGGFASPAWSGYQDHYNMTNKYWCSYCYNPSPCREEPERRCMREISVSSILRVIHEIEFGQRGND